MKTISICFWTVLMAMSLTFSGCEKEDPIDLANIKAEVKLQCVNKEYDSSSDNHPDCTFVCSGYIGGFTGPASIEISGGGFWVLRPDFIIVSGDSTSFNFTFEETYIRKGKHNVEVEISSKGQTVFKSVCVVEI